MRFLVALVILLGGCDSGDLARHERAIPWALAGQWLAADLHTHSRYSDGALSVRELTGRAVMNGCGVLAITDHGDAQTRSVTAEFFEEVELLRKEFPQLVLLTGVEWNVPPHEGREHANLIVDPRIEVKVLPQFKTLFDRVATPGAAEAALKWLAQTSPDAAQRVLIYNHPLRHDAAKAERFESDVAALRSAGDTLVGFEGGPGHQRGPKVGAYGALNPLQDRWDPAVAQIGGAWDRLLSRGVDVWGAIASSDFHNDRYDEEPCRFSRTMVQVPERSAQGVLQAIRAGTFWAGHGGFLRHLALTVQAPGLRVPASPGEVVRYRAGAAIDVRLAIDRASNAVDASLRAEIIGNCRTGRTESIASVDITPGTNEVDLPVRGVVAGEDGESCYVRARVRMPRGADGDWLAYTNPIRIRMK